ncbi:uncharacterized protein NEMAJ01_1220 [Nematocida major]|uniref:uncharacterized protein n=1 Tax=Nematocida major TaxID=1912982 RepID=UPI002007E88D|nr:uncharacterized protein NEMAJ01_1220 [Nematocida major]KAH9386324.1 hypothetical protein NEMAJ01_1220 [Nematocida major]
MPIQGGELNYNKDKDDKKKPEDGKPAGDKPTSTEKPKADTPRPGPSSAERPTMGAPNPEKSAEKSANPFSGEKAAQEKRPDPLLPKTQPTAPSDKEKIESSKLSNTAGPDSKVPGSVPVPPKPSASSGQGNSRPMDQKAPMGGNSRPSAEPSRPGAGLKETGAAASLSSGNSAPKSTGNLDKNISQSSQEEEEPNPIVKFFRTIKNAIMGFCCQTEDDIRHIA